MRTLEGNKLIAEFMGLRYGSSSVRTYVIENNIEVLTKDLKYHTSWDWLMPVVEKIEEVLSGDAIVTIQYKDVIIDDYDGCGGVIRVDQVDFKIDAVYQAVVEFIQWYNENK